MLFYDLEEPHRCRMFNFNRRNVEVELHAIVGGVNKVDDLDLKAYEELKYRVPYTVAPDKLDFEEIGDKSINDKYYEDRRRNIRRLSLEEQRRMKRHCL